MLNAALKGFRFSPLKISIKIKKTTEKTKKGIK